MILPKKDKEGLYYISNSQINAWNDIKGFNLGIPGKQEYIRSYFLGEKYPTNSFATFGKDVEDYITTGAGKDKFTVAERAVLDPISTLGNYQHEFKLKYDDFYVWGFIDDHNDDYTTIRDYKTASIKSKAKYDKPDYYQLDLYALAIQQEQGLLPTTLEAVVIERTGNGYKGGRAVLKVGETVWYIKRETNAERLATLEVTILRTVQEISHHYQVFLKLNK